MTPDLTAQIIASLAACEKQNDIICERLAVMPGQIMRSVRSEIDRVSKGLSEIRRAMHNDLSLTTAGAIETTPHETRALDQLVVLLTGTPDSWTLVATKLADAGYTDDRGREFKRDRLIHMAIAAAGIGGARYARGCPVAGEVLAPADGPKLYDLFNLPRLVGGAGGLAPIVRGCYDGGIRYGMTWRFAGEKDLARFPIADDDDDLDDLDDLDDDTPEQSDAE